MKMELYFDYLEKLRQSGKTNMYGAVPYLCQEFPQLSKTEAREILSAWMKSKQQEESERHA